MSQTKRPPRRPTKRPERATLKTRPVRLVEPSDDTTVSLLRAQVARAEASQEAAEQALEEEKEARYAEAVQLGEMMALLGRLEPRAIAAERASDELRQRLEEERRRATDSEARLAHLQIDLREALSLAEARGEELNAERMRARRREQERSEAQKPEGGARDTHTEREAVTELKAQLDASRAEANQLRDSLEGLRKRAGAIGAGLKEMRELMVVSAALFDDLEGREHAIAEIRARSLREARALFLRAAGPGAASGLVPPPLPKMPIEDLSDAAELLEEEVRASLRPTPSSMR